jgi:hypothetical protein
MNAYQTLQQGDTEVSKPGLPGISTKEVFSELSPSRRHETSYASSHRYLYHLIQNSRAFLSFKLKILWEAPATNRDGRGSLGRTLVHRKEEEEGEEEEWNDSQAFALATK